MHVVVSIIIVLIVLIVLFMGAVGFSIFQSSRQKPGNHEASAEEQDQEHEAWVNQLWNDSELFVTGSEVTNP